MNEYRTYKVQSADRRPLLDFMYQALIGSGCRILKFADPTEAPFRFTFETPDGERMGVIAYAFRANSKLTKNRPADEHRFQVKYGSDDKKLHQIWSDPFSLYTTLFIGIDPERGIFVGADPVLHDETRFFISVEFKGHHVQGILARDWHSWERDHRAGDDTPTEVLVGGTAKSFLRYVRFEREVYAEDPGHRQLLAEGFGRPTKQGALTLPTAEGPVPAPNLMHALSREFEMTEAEVLDMIGQARMVKMAVRGAVAEAHLLKQLSRIPGVSQCRKPEVSDVALQFLGRPLRVECKNVLRNKTSDGLVRIDLQRTRASKSDPCSRYYSPQDFEVVAGCLHAVTLKWEFQFAIPARLDSHKSCPGKLSNNVKLDHRWSAQAATILREAAGTFRGPRSY